MSAMNPLIFRTAIAAATLLGVAGLGIGASITSTPSLMAKADYVALKEAIVRSIEDDLDTCKPMAALARSECVAELRADEAVQLAELEVRYRGTVAAAREAQLARIDAAYRAERAKCIAKGGAERDSCLIAAHARKAHERMELRDGVHDASLMARTVERPRQG